MANYLRPGVFINEAPMTNPSIQPANSSVGAFLGITQRGPANVAVKVTSWTDYVSKFAFGLASAFYSGGYNGYSVYGFFNNGGTSYYQTRVTAVGAAAASYTYVDNAGTPANVLKFTASAILPDNTLVDDPGIWGNQLSLNLALNGSNYDVTILYNGVTVETFKNCSLTATDPQFIETVINTFSKYVRVQRLGATVVNPTLLGSAKPLTGGLDGLPAASDFTTQLVTLEPIQNDISLIVCPDCQTASFIQAAYAKAALYSAYFITDGALTDTVATIQTFRSGLSSDAAALYFPWIQVYDPIAANKLQPVKYIPSAGHIAGVYAETDANRGTFKAPAGITDGVINGALATKTALSSADEDALNSNQINIIRPIKNAGIVAWGARGLSTGGTMYVPVRRELSKIERTVKDGTRWAVFEPNTVDTWNKITNTVRAFLFREMEAGAFAGVKPDGSDSFFVVCDATNNTPATINQGIINVQIGVAQVKPGEFLVINIGQIQ
jgi:phage tail sheath protein FI